ncbi:MAG: hypothetical protein J7L25_06595 [Deltaproteobacteria bacterium]|nr:hypothetical protein [Candidatus Tharpella aukensis]
MVTTTRKIQQEVVTFAKQKIGHKVGGGECFDLANKALAKAKGKTASDYGNVTLAADYVWGDLVATAMAQPGDILQFRNYQLKITTTTLTKVTHGKDPVAEYDGTGTKTLSRPHHTAVITKGGAKKLEILEQNVVRGTSGVKEKKVGPETIPHTNNSSTQINTKKVSVTKGWGTKAKKYIAKKNWPNFDSLVKHYMKKSVTEKTTVTVKVQVTGTLKAYRPKPK